MSYRYLATFADGSTHEIKRSSTPDYAFAWRCADLSRGQHKGFSRTSHHAQQAADYAAKYARARGETITTEVVPVERIELKSRKPKAAA